METGKLDKKTIAAGIFFILYGLLLLAVRAANTAFYGTSVAQVFSPGPWILGVVAPIICAIMLFIRNKTVAAVGMGIMTAWAVYVLVSSIMQYSAVYQSLGFMQLMRLAGADLTASLLLVLTCVMLTCSLAMAGKGGKAFKVLAVVFAIVWFFAAVAASFGGVSLGDPDMLLKRVPVVLIYGFRATIGLVALLIAACIGPEKLPAPQQYAQQYAQPYAQYAQPYAQQPYAQPYGQPYAQPQQYAAPYDQQQYVPPRQ